MTWPKLHFNDTIYCTKVVNFGTFVKFLTYDNISSLISDLVSIFLTGIYLHW